MDGMLKSLIELFGDTILGYLDIFLPIGGSIFILLITAEILREAVDIVNGKGVNLGPKLILILFTGTLLLGFNKLSRDIYAGAENIGNELIPKFQEINTLINEEYRAGVEDQQANLELDRESMGILTSLFLSMTLAILSGLGLLLVYLAMILIIVLIAGAYASLALTLLLGPVFISMLVSETFRQTAVKWAVIVLSNFLVIPVYIVIIKISASLYASSLSYGSPPFPFSASSGILQAIEKIGFLMMNPLLTFGLIFSVSKIVGSITGSAGSIGEKAVGAAGTAVAMTVVAARGGMKLMSGGKSGSRGGGGGNGSGGGDTGHGGGPGEGREGNDPVPEPNPPEGHSGGAENGGSENGGEAGSGNAAGAGTDALPEPNAPEAPPAPVTE